ncbi:hypothetical protein M2275_008016 [Rhodococcus opacus]|nr:hypothetical protein [Rhodococcus opacus]
MSTDRNTSDSEGRPPPEFGRKGAMIFGALIVLLAVLTYLDSLNI